MTDPSRLPGKPTVLIVLLTALCALAGTVLLTAATVRHLPRRPAAAQEGDRPSPTPRSSSTREPGPPLCVIGSWQVAEDTVKIKFYTDADATTFTGSGRLFEFRPDGTGTEKHDNHVLKSTFEGNEIRIVSNGAQDFTWTTKDGTITYLTRTSSTLVYSYYDQRGLLDSHPAAGPGDLYDTNDFTCERGRAVESRRDVEYRSVWNRTTAYGVYG
ncbi:hypothetical protein [Actinosynnema sp. NPDC020468]|uniref:hypothetical protein n=1 Tax=Actinosynnema sp. NPDC020468 TaxID=3154488 RepID=UPI0034018575